MSLMMAVIAAMAAGGVAGLILRAIFRRINPNNVQGYIACAGNWHEAHLNGCKARLTHVPQQPVNTYTNLAYLTGGLVAVFDLQTPTAYPFALASSYLCIGSALYHATSSRWAGILDVSGMYAVFTGLGAFALGQVLGFSTGWLAGGTLLISVIFAILAYAFRRMRKQEMQYIIGFSVLSIYALILLGMWLRSDWSWLWPVLSVSFALFVTAFVIWNLDKKRLFPLPGWGHGVWHLMTSVAIVILFYTIHGVG